MVILQTVAIMRALVHWAYATKINLLSNLHSFADVSLTTILGYCLDSNRFKRLMGNSVNGQANTKLGSPVDLLLLAFVIGLAPLLVVQASRLAGTASYAYVLPAVLFFVVGLGWGGKLLSSRDLASTAFAMMIGVFGVLLAVASAIMFSPWLAQVSMVLAIIAWVLFRMSTIHWFSVVAFSLLLLVTLPFPKDWGSRVHSAFSASGFQSASAMLDQSQVPNVVSAVSINVENGQLNWDEAFFALPTVVFVTLSIAILTRASLVQLLLPIFLAPVWSWLFAVLATFSAVLASEHSTVGLKICYQVSQVLCLILICMFIYATQLVVKLFLRPFQDNFDGQLAHTTFNQVVAWPTIGEEATNTGELPPSALRIEKIFAIFGCLCLGFVLVWSIVCLV